jgi:hypothetical protein
MNNLKRESVTSNNESEVKNVKELIPTNIQSFPFGSADKQ